MIYPHAITDIRLALVVLGSNLRATPIEKTEEIVRLQSLIAERREAILALGGAPEAPLAPEGAPA